jgi:hypothetical protein
MILAHIPTAMLVVVLASVVLPAVSAAVTRLHWDSSITGIITALLSTATGFLTEWGQAGSGFDWKTAAVTALASWLVAVATQSRILSGTALEARLLLFGNRSSVSAGEPDPTVGLDPTAPAADPTTQPAPLVQGTMAPPQTPPAVPVQPAQAPAPVDPAPVPPTA